MTHYKELLDTSFIGQWDFKRDPKTGERKRYTLEIESVSRYKPVRPRTKKCPAHTGSNCRACNGKGRVVEPNKRLLITFKGARKPWLAGPVSQEAIVAMFGNDVDKWPGKKLTLYVDESVTMGRVKTGGVRCAPVPGQGPAEDMPEEPVDEELAQRIADAFDETGVEPG
ncbi:MAG TPA: hypothetical protein VMT97_09890 [Terriglobales bacterium]|nr:hypothetical protein [Terriglobales bacterium]